MNNSVIWVEMLGLLLLAGGTGAEPPRIILDTDMRGDCDDVGALATLHALADNGECEILGVIASTTGPHIVATIGAINAYYGRPYLPVGLYSGEDLTGPDSYAEVIGDPMRYPSRIANETAPDSTGLYRRLLHEAPDHSVTIVVIGGQSCIHGLLQSESDFEGDGSIGRTGRELIEEKVRELVLMAGVFVEMELVGEWNVLLDIPAAQQVAREWPGPIVYTGSEIGHGILTGASLTDPENNPVAMSYKLHPYTEGGPGVIGGRSSWDQTAVYYAVRGVDFEGEAIWDKAGPIAISFTDEGNTRFEENPAGSRHYLTQRMPIDRTAAIIEDLMNHAPRASIAIKMPSADATYPQNSAIPIEGEVIARDLDVERVVFAVDDDPIAEVDAAPYIAEWEATHPGTYTIQAYVDGDDGSRFYARPTVVTVVE